MPKVTIEMSAVEYDLLRRVLREHLETVKLIRSGNPASWEKTRPLDGLSPRQQAQVMETLLEKVER
jgi:hypothetical protein